MAINLMTPAEKEQLIRVLLLTSGHTSFLDLKLNTPALKQLSEHPLGTEETYAKEVITLFQTWLLTHLKHCYEKETVEEIHLRLQDNYEDALVKMQAKLHLTWDGVLSLCQEKLHHAKEADLEKLTHIGELCLAPYLRNEKEGLENIASDMKLFYLQLENKSNSSSFLLHQLRLHKLEVAEWFHDFTHAILYQTANASLNPTQKIIAQWAEHQTKKAIEKSHDKNSDLLMLGRALISDLNAAVLAIDQDYKEHTIQSLFFKSEAKLAKGFREIIRKHPEFSTLEVSLLPPDVQAAKTAKPFLTIDPAETVVDIIVQVNRKSGYQR